MASKKIDYGTKKMIYSSPRKAPAPLFILGGIERPAAGRRSGNSGNRADTSVPVAGCYCPECRKAFSLNLPDLKYSRYARNAGFNSLYLSDSSANALMDAAPACPECGLSGRYCVVPKQRAKDAEEAVKAASPEAEDTEPADMQSRADRLSDENMADGARKSHINYEGSWLIPSLLRGRYVFAFEDGDGATTRVDDNFMFDNAVIFPGMKSFSWQTEFSQQADLVQNRVLSYETGINGNGRYPIGKARDLSDIFRYTAGFGSGADINVQNAEQNMPINITKAGGTANLTSFRDVITASAFGNASRLRAVYRKEHASGIIVVYREGHGSGIMPPEAVTDDTYGGESPEDINAVFREATAAKARAIAGRFKGTLPHPVYSDLSLNGLNLKEHHRGSTEENTATDWEKASYNMYFMARYPAAVELAAQKAETRALNYEFAEKRKAAAKPGYKAKSATDSARAKFFREEMAYVGEQLCACDDKLLPEISAAGKGGPCYVFEKGRIVQKDRYESPSGDSSALAEMKDRLSFFAYGLRDGYPVPASIAGKLKDGRTLAEAPQSTKKLKALFEENPIATASNVYTLQKWGIRDINHVMDAISLVASQSEPVNPPDLRLNGRRVPAKRVYREFVNADVMAPVRTSTEMRFLRNYAATHDTKAMIYEILDNRASGQGAGDAPRRKETMDGKWRAFAEDINLYQSLIDNPRVDIIQTKKDLKKLAEHTGEEMSEGEKHEAGKAQLRNYLLNSGEDGIRTAYRDFAPIYGRNTKEMVNTLAREIREDMKIDKIKRFAEKNGMDAALSKYREYLAKFDDPAEAVTRHAYFSDRNVTITTRNNKPLFEQGNLADIHDALSDMGRKNVKENEYLDLPPEIAAMSESIEVDLSKLPESQYADPGAPRPPEGTMGSFHFQVMENRFDFVRAATDLRNCVAGGSYFDNMKHGSAVIAVMRDEHHMIRACIELKKDHNPANGTEWKVTQFQGYRDTSVDRRYYPAFQAWCENHAIDYTSDPSGNVQACASGQKTQFFGNADTDFHTDEFDPVLNLSFPIRRAEQLRQSRVEKALELYGGSQEDPGSPMLPSVPDDLEGFDIHA